MSKELKYPTECPACGSSSWEPDSDDKCVTRYCGDCGQEMQPIEPLDLDKIKKTAASFKDFVPMGKDVLLAMCDRIDELEKPRKYTDYFAWEREMKKVQAENTLLREALESKIVKCCKTCDSFVDSTYPGPPAANLDNDGHCPFHSCEKKYADTCDKWNIEALKQKGNSNGRT